MTVLVVLMVIFYFYEDVWMQTLTDSFIMLTLLMLLYSCVYIRKVIISLETPFPNELFIRIHWINFSIYLLLNILQTVLAAILSKAENDGDDQMEDRTRFALSIANNIQYPTGFYVDCFLLYLIERFTASPNQKTHDKVLQ